MATKADLAERDLRFRRTREAMEQEGLDALIVAGKGHWWTGRGYFRYFSDFHLWGHDALILVPLTGEPTLAITSARIAALSAKRNWISDGRGDPNIPTRIIEAMREKGLVRGKVGLAGLRFIMSAGTYDMLTSGLPDVKFVNADRLMDRIRMVKSPLEIKQYGELWALAKQAMQRFVEVLEPGKAQRELAAEALKVVTVGGGRDVLIFFDGNVPEDIPVAGDDILSYHMEICGGSGHWCELTVTCAFRDPTSQELKLMDSELRAYDEICRMAKPGVKISAMVEVFERVLQEDGWKLSSQKIEHYDFHGQGMDCIEWPFYPPEPPLYTPHDAVLEEGMVLCYHPHRRVVPDLKPTGICDDILITANGALRLSGDWDLRWRTMK